MRIHALILFLLVTHSAAWAQDNAELAALFTADQASRQAATIDWAVVNAADAERRAAVMSILKVGGIRSAADYYHAAMIFQHGDSEDDIRLAHSFATISAAMERSPASNWLMAASWDRLMLRFEQPQWYGTQYVRNESGKWVLYKVQPGAVTDQQRTAWSVPSLAEAQKRVSEMNGDR